MDIIKSNTNEVSGNLDKCPKCGAGYGSAPHNSIVVSICPACLSITKSHKVSYTKTSRTFKSTPVLPLGIKGKLQGKEYTVISCAEKFLKNDPYAQWHEYSLLTDDDSFAVLSFSEGHWIFLQETDKNKIEKVAEDDTRLIYQSRIYDFFTKYKVRTRLAVGRFPYDVLKVDESWNYEFIAPPYMLTQEHELTGPETTYHGIYLKPGKVARAFGMNSWHFPNRSGVGACQPFPFGINKGLFVVCNIVALVIGLLVYGAVNSKHDQELTRGSVYVGDSLGSRRLITPSFELKDQMNCLKISASCISLNNDWLEADVSLVNETNGAERSYNAGMEYYSGYDSDGHWTEGSTSTENYINSVEPGTYHLEIEVYRNAQSTPKNVIVLAELADPLSHNFLVVAGSLALLTLLIYYGADQFEKARHGILWGD